jgi:hypothetical protein
MRTSGIARVLVCALLVLWGASNVQARNLSDGIDFLFGDLGIALDVDPVNGIPHRAHFTSESLATLGLLVRQLAPSAADFPAISTVPGFTFRYNPQLQVFERSSGSLGPVFVERPQTVGGGKFDFGVSYLSVDFEELEGDDLDELQFTGLQHNDCCSATAPPPSPDNPAFEEDTADIFFETFELRSHVLSFFATYGIADRWDVNFLLPIVFTSLHLRARAHLNNESGTNTHFFDIDTRAVDKQAEFDDDKTGVGDLQLRTKYRLFEANGFSVASGLSLRLPTGDEDDFQGLGDPTLTPFAVAAYEFGRLDLHASSGIEINFDDSDRSRVRYAGGATLQLIEQVALLVDVVGSSNLKTDRVGVTVQEFVNAPGTSEGTPTTIPVSQRVNAKVNTDIVDLNVGFKISPFSPQWSFIGFATVFVPLNNDGLRADFIPAVGLEMGF